MNSYENEQLSYECDLTAERDRLREINAELLAALEGICSVIEPDGSSGVKVADCVIGNLWLRKARAAIAKAKGDA